MTLTAPQLDGETATRSRRTQARDALRRSRGRCAAVLRRAAAWRWTGAVPGLAGVLLTSAAAGGLVAWTTAWPAGLWAGLGVLGLWLLRIDHRAG